MISNLSAGSSPILHDQRDKCHEMIPPTLQDSFTVGISNSWQQTDSVAKAWIPSECCARFDQFSADCNGQSLMLRRRRPVLISSSIPTQLPPEAPVRKCGRRGWSLRRQPLYSCTVVMLMLVLSLSLPLSHHDSARRVVFHHWRLPHHFLRDWFMAVEICDDLFPCVQCLLLPLGGAAGASSAARWRYDMIIKMVLCFMHHVHQGRNAIGRAMRVNLQVMVILSNIRGKNIPCVPAECLLDLSWRVCHVLKTAPIL